MFQKRHTSMVFSKFDFLLEFQIVSIHFCIEAVVLFEDTCQRSYASVDTAPMSYALTGIDLRHYILEVLLPE
jgi:hypothetical protein